MATKRVEQYVPRKLDKAMSVSDWFSLFPNKLPGQVTDEEIQNAKIEREQNPVQEEPTKKPLSEIQPVKAADWFKKNPDRLPTDIDSGVIPEEKIKKTKKETETADVEIFAPEHIEVDVNIKAPPVQSILSSKQEALNSVKAADDDSVKHKDFDKLADSILKLSGIIKDNKLQKIKDDEDAYEEKKPQSILELFKSIASEKKKEIADKFSIRGLLTMSGVNSAYRGTSTVLDQVLTHFEDKKKEAQKQKEENTKPSPIKNALGEYFGNKVKDNITNPIKGKASDVNSLIKNSKLGQVSSNIFTTVETKKNQTVGLFDSIKNAAERKVKTSAIEEPKSLLGTLGRHLYPAIEKDPQIKAYQMIKDPEMLKNKEFHEGVKEGIRDELVKLNKEQLEQLEKIVQTLHPTQEQNFSSKDEKPQDITFSQKKEKEKDDNKSILSKLMEGFGSLKGIVGKLGGVLGSIGSTVARFALPGLAVAGAGAVGYGVGSLINNKILDPTMEKLSGVKGATLGTTLYDTVDSVKGWFGNSDADKLNLNDKKAAKTGDSVKKMVAPTSTVKELTNGELTKDTGVSKVVVSPKAKQETPIVKSDSVYRINQMDKVKSTIKETERLKEVERAESKASNIVDARTNVVNNSNTIQYVRPQVRNNDSTFNRILGLNFSN